MQDRKEELINIVSQLTNDACCPVVVKFQFFHDGDVERYAVSGIKAKEDIHGMFISKDDLDTYVKKLSPVGEEIEKIIRDIYEGKED